jgi:hypothetical protein
MAYHQDMADVPDWNGIITSKNPPPSSLLSKIFEEKTKHTYQKKVTLETKKKRSLDVLYY